MTRPKRTTARQATDQRRPRNRLRSVAGPALLGVAAVVALGLFGLRLRVEREPETLLSEDMSGPSTGGPKSDSSRPYKVEGNLTIEDGITFRLGDGPLIRLAALTAPSRDAVCLNGGGMRWACGLQARAALNNIMRKQEVWCQTIFDAAEYRWVECTVDNIDLGRLVVRQGFARPADGSETLALIAARNENKGLWDGGWTFVRPNDASKGR